jgi:hypothetical protein
VSSTCYCSLLFWKWYLLVVTHSNHCIIVKFSLVNLELSTECSPWSLHSNGSKIHARWPIQVWRVVVVVCFNNITPKPRSRLLPVKIFKYY